MIGRMNSNTKLGIYLRHSSNNTTYHTNYNTYDSCTNQWDSGSAGNYYSDYNGTDPGGDSIDRYPLIQPWTGVTPQKGDLNSDGILTPADAVIALEIAAGSRPCDATTLATADVSGDGEVTSLDALMILQATADTIELP